MTATNNLIEDISCKGTTDFMSGLAQTRTKQLCEEMSVTKELMKNLLLAAAPKGIVRKRHFAGFRPQQRWQRTWGGLHRQRIPSDILRQQS